MPGSERDRLMDDAHKKADAFSAEQATALRSNLASLSKEITRQAERGGLCDLAPGPLGPGHGQP
jgi:hypothetical protein